MIYYKKIGPLIGDASLRLYTAVVFPTRPIESDEVEVLSITRGPDIEDVCIKRHVMKTKDIEGEPCTTAKLLADLNMMTSSIEAQV